MHKLLYTLAVTIGLLSAAAGCSGTAGENDVSLCDDAENVDRALALLDSLANPAPSKWTTANDMPDDECIKLVLNYPGPPLRKLFNDSNYVQYAAAEALGIDPITNDSAARHIKRPLELVVSDRYKYIDSLKYSYPYLVPESHALLNDIATRFHDTLQARGGGNYRLKVTSMLRTSASVSKLRRVNRASVDSSAHLFGTTFDISFKSFPYDGGKPHRTQEDLKNLLAEILYDLRNQGRCYVKYEHRQGCYHITARPKH